MAKWKFTAARRKNIKKAQLISVQKYAFTHGRQAALRKARQVLEKMRKAGMPLGGAQKGKQKKLGL